ncbi:MBL fold metallo-hydrolase, partial [Candidatus Woesearchaeota archaeon]|nr:MBL fold metallo-hydrolase [Candidatus Woesearchaeota archaeon]
MADIEVSGETCLTYYIDDKKKVLIDAGSNIGKKVDIIILTHCHYDHIGYLYDIVQKWHPIVMASEKAAD